MNGHQRSTRKRPRAVPSCPHGFPAPQITASRSHDPSRESFPALLSACELIPSSDGGYAGLSKWCVNRSRNRSSPPRQQSTIVVSIFLALLWGFATASNTTTTSNVASIHNRAFDRTERGKNAQLNFASNGHQAHNRELGPPRFDPRLRFCSNIASRLCGKCSSYYKLLVKKKKCKRKECKKKFRICMFKKSRRLVQKFNLHCDKRLKVTWPIKNIFGRRGRYRGRKFDYRKMRLVDWCRPPKVRRPRPRNGGDCGEEIEYYAEMEVLLDLYCPVNEQNQPIQPQDERSLMERGILQFLNSESECFGEDECEQIRYDTSTIQELIAGEDCCPIYAAQNIACPTTSRFLISEEFDGSMESFEAIMNRQLQRRKKTKVKKRLSGRCRSRKKKCRRKEKRRRLEVSFDSMNGSMSIPVGDGGGKVSTYFLRNGGIGRIDNGSEQHEENPLPRPTHVARHLQTNALEANIGDLTPVECEALTLEESIRQQDPVAFRTITSTEEEEYVEYPSCQDPSSFECNSPLGGYVCCGKGQCKCDIGSNTRCEEGTLFGTTQTQCYLNSDGLQGSIASRQDNLCCDLYVGPPISYRYDCSASVCGPLPTAQCGRQPWINTIDSGSINARAGSFVIEVDFNIIDVCSATLANRNSIEMTVRSVVDTYVKNLIQYSGCGRSNLSENGITVSSVNVVANTDKCPGSSRRLGVPEGTASRKLQSGTTCVDSTTGQTSPSVTFSARITGQFRTYQPLAFPIEEGIVYDGFDPPASAPSPGGQNACSCDSLICKEVRDALINTSGANIKNAGVTTTTVQISTPTPSPTKAPSKSPTTDPTRNPTSSPTRVPTKQPTPRPTSPPTRRPTKSPTNTPSRLPSDIPSVVPSTLPSRSPSLFPSSGPTKSSALPSLEPSSTPSLDQSPASEQPSLIPSSKPSERPSLIPSSKPSEQPSLIPSSKPSEQPSSGPSARPSVSNAPSFEPSVSLSPSVSQAPTQDFGLGRMCTNASECEAPPPFSGNDGSAIDAWLDITNMNITCAVKAKDIGTNETRCCIPTGAPCSSKIKTTDNDPFKGCCNQGCSGGILGTCG